ncbi:hypothetical protein SEMRO_1417_G270900.1 [Seminavis robusta]|uniref:Uncharacterized protein n=1 Tax=Seminavis robusta TaxID=568900 RepID=A0A9N8ERN4_9STRA|nr:hypothetical protein SEMRO_1417_G270900.1 [Seminavis robusta]|eukprot:Sro1417_g270900.1 n/a (146) ;mRNA; f:12772-13209
MAHDGVATAAKELLQSKKDHTKWRKPDYQLAIQWKQGPNPSEPNNEKTDARKDVLVALWKNKYKDLEAPTGGWTDQDEEKLQALKGGEIECFERDVGLQHCFETENEGIALRLLAFTKQRRKNVLLRVLRALDDGEMEDIQSDLL